jgi:hypothetical protein
LRDQRVSVRLSVRVKTDFGGGDAQIQNISTRGMMATCAAPPPRGTYVEVRRGTYVVVGRVVWSSNDAFGLIAQDAIALPDLTASTAPSAPCSKGGEPRNPRLSRARHKDAAGISAACAKFARAFDFVAVVAIVLVGALLLTQTVWGVFAAPFQKVSAAMR